MGQSWAPWLKKRGGVIRVPPSEAQPWRLGAILGRSWALLGPSWTLWGPSWGSLGPSCGHLEASEAHRKRKGEKANNIGFLCFWTDFGYLEGAVEGSKGIWNRLGAVLGSLGGMSEAILTHLEVAWAIWEAILRL